MVILMKQSFLISGTGGQGVQLFGQLIAYCATAQGLFVTFDADYSGNMRGAPSNCTVILSDMPIDSPIERRPDNFIVFQQEAMDKLLMTRVADGGTVYYDSTLAAECPELRPDVTFIGCPATALAEEMGKVKAANMIMLGFFCRRSAVLDSTVMCSVIEQQFSKKPLLLPLNRAAFEKGSALA